MISSAFGKIVNEHGEMVAEGTCEVDDDRGSVTLRPLLDMPLLERQRGLLRLILEDGSELLLTDRVIHFKVNLPGQRPGSVYKLYIARQQGLGRWGERRQETGDTQQPTGNMQHEQAGKQEAGSGDMGGERIQGSEHDPTRDPDALPLEFRKDEPR